MSRKCFFKNVMEAANEAVKIAEAAVGVAEARLAG